MTMITVEPQVTEVTVPAKTPEETQQEAEQGGQLNIAPKFSHWFPWFWLQTWLHDPISGLSMVTCTSLFGEWLENYYELENPLYEIFEGVPQGQIESLQSIAISSITTASFLGGYIASKLLEWNLPAYAIAMGAYFAVASLVLLTTFAAADAYTAKATLITVGWTLLSLSTLGFAATIPIYMSNIVGSDPVTAAVRSLAKAIINVSVITPLLKTLGVSIGGFLFYLFNFILGILALTLGYQIVL